MHSNITGLYRPRAVSDLGLWDIERLRLKVYGIVAEGREMTEDTIAFAHKFVCDEVPPLIAAEGQSNDLGFVIIHPGELGVSVLAHWWIQGSVLCQHIHRKVCGTDKPMNTAARAVIA